MISYFEGDLMYLIRKLTYNEVEEALALALEVFMQFEAPDYRPEGVEALKKILLKIRNLSIIVSREFAQFMLHLTIVKLLVCV